MHGPLNLGIDMLLFMLCPYHDDELGLTKWNMNSLDRQVGPVSMVSYPLHIVREKSQQLLCWNMSFC